MNILDLIVHGQFDRYTWLPTLMNYSHVLAYSVVAILTIIAMCVLIPFLYCACAVAIWWDEVCQEQLLIQEFKGTMKYLK